MEDNKPFDLKALDATFNSRIEAYEMLEIESIKKCKANVARQWAEVKNQRHQQNARPKRNKMFIKRRKNKFDELCGLRAVE